MKIYSCFIKLMVCIIFFLMLGIICKFDSCIKSFVRNKLYYEYFDFSSVKEYYDKYLGGVIISDNISRVGVESVFREELRYKDFFSYKDGVELVVDYNYLVPVIKGGVVVYIGEKDYYGMSVIVEGDDGVDVWYGNMDEVMVGMYDVVLPGSYLGSVSDRCLYLVFTDGNEVLNYNDYLN